MEGWNIGVMEGWNVGVMEGWNVGVVMFKRQNNKDREIKDLSK